MTEACSIDGQFPLEPLACREALNAPPAPFVHRFKTNKGCYVYDVNTSRILRVSPVVWDIIEDFGREDEQRILARHGRVHGPKAVADAIKAIKKNQSEGLLLAFYPGRIVPYHEPDLRQRLDSLRIQLILNLTEDCNFRCTYCVFSGQYPNRRKHSSRRMTWETAQAAIDDFMPHSRLSERRYVSFYGGEPLLESDLLRKCVGYIKQRYPDLPRSFCITTNGSLLSGAASEFLAEEDFLITVSLDGPEAVHDRHRRDRGGQPTFARVMENVRAFLADHPQYKTNHQLRFSAVAGRETDLRELRAFFSQHEPFTESMGLGFSLQSPIPGDDTAACPDDPLPESFSALYGQFVGDLKSGRYGQAYGSRETLLATAAFDSSLVRFHKRKYVSPHLPESITAPSGCLPGARRVFVNAEGEYFPCERAVECEGHAIGSVREGIVAEKVMALLDRWNRATLPVCGCCFCLPACDAGCLASAWNDGTADPAAKSAACARHRQEFHRLLIEYSGIMEENPKAFDFTAELVIS